MKGLSYVIIVGIAVLAFVIVLWTPSADDLARERDTKPQPTMIVPPIPYPPFEVPRTMWPPEQIEAPKDLDCSVGDFLQDKSTDPDWNQCPMLI